MKGFGTNVFGPIRVTHAFLPLLRAFTAAAYRSIS